MTVFGYNRKGDTDPASLLFSEGDIFVLDGKKYPLKEIYFDRDYAIWGDRRIVCPFTYTKIKKGGSDDKN